jgi:hypothetical protein
VKSRESTGYGKMREGRLYEKNNVRVAVVMDGGGYVGE